MTPAHDTLAALAQTIEQRRHGDPDQSYVARLLAKAPDAVLKKIGEEATEVVMAAKDLSAGHGTSQALVGEMADLWFHTMVALSHLGIPLSEVSDCLAERLGVSGLDEKAARGQPEN